MGETYAEIARSGPVLLALGLAALAGLVSFLSPCVLPLAPGYLSYVTGLAGSDLDAGDGGSAGRYGRVLAGTLLFIAGFTAVFTLTAVVVAGVGQFLFTYQRAVEIVIGALIVLLGLAFLGLVPGMQRELRVRRLPEAGLVGAPVFGAVFALSWTPCVGPTLGAVIGMATVSGQTDRAAALAVAYCLGLGLPFLVFGLAFRRLLGVFTLIRRNSRWITRIGGGLLIGIGVALMTGGWNSFVIWIQATFGVGEVSI
ncbi:cytochrome c biogenesis protein CcdA [Solwaraspora sp. WMMD406]|uniref:cytochrome c biogenesis CcdA family protein n=1 Tax=Solwaraspora sp. WMMD406 TaxID=3016095 RepID=UPI002417CC20|nr:cytochrome c biogenesis protein CcdA [Solwaraspora sp. WMMD406]MDG4763245.1 cytochrome c biogenesis protein CcdA [Solwaraspora sp. WMMD406]